MSYGFRRAFEEQVSEQWTVEFAVFKLQKRQNKLWTTVHRLWTKEIGEIVLKSVKSQKS
jgi:hypothetical protein